MYDRQTFYDMLNMVCGRTYALGWSSPWREFLYKHCRKCSAYEYLVCGDNDQYAIIPEYNTEVNVLNEGMTGWSYSEWTVLKPETQDAKYEWFLNKCVPYFDVVKHGIEVDDNGDLRVDSAKQFKREYYSWMKKKLGYCAVVHKGTSHCVPLKGFMIYMANHGHKVYESIPLPLIDKIKECGTLNTDNIHRLREEMTVYAQTLDRSEYDIRYFDEMINWR